MAEDTTDTTDKEDVRLTGQALKMEATPNTGLNRGAAVDRSSDLAVGTYGTFTIKRNGNWEYTIKNDDLDRYALALATSEIDVFQIKASDDTKTTITIMVAGANDTAELLRT